MNVRPNVFFTTNQKDFGSKYVCFTIGDYIFPFIDHCGVEKRIVKYEDGSETLLLSIPRFSSTSEVVLLNIRTLECRKIHFDASFDEVSFFTS